MTEEREARRRTVVLSGTLIHGGTRFPCLVRDVSAGGCRVECDTQFAAATPLHIEFSRYGKFPAIVAWIEGKFMGIVFPEGAAVALARFGERAVNLGIADPGEVKGAGSKG